MKHLKLKHIIAGLLLAILGLIVFHAPMTVFIESRWPGLEDIAKAWKEILLFVALILLCIDVTRKGAWKQFTNDKLLWALLLFAVLHIVLIFTDMTEPMAVIAGLMIDLRYLAYFAAVYIFLRLYPDYERKFLKAALFGALLVIGFAVLQLALPRDFLHYLGYSDTTIKPYLTVDENPNFVRHNSTLRGPNPLGAYAVMVLGGVVALGMVIGKQVKSKRFQYVHLALALGALVALWSSQSRSAWIAALVTIVLLAAMKYGKYISRQAIGWIVLGAVVLAVGMYSIRDTYFFHNVILHDNPTTGADIDSNAGHLDSLLHGLSSMLMNPLGNGVGSTGSASMYGSSPVVIENQYLFIAHEVGWLGLALFMYIFVTTLRRLWQRRDDWMAAAVFASGIGLAVIGLLLPVWVDDTVSIVWWGISAVILAGEGTIYGKQTNKKAKRAA